MGTLPPNDDGRHRDPASAGAVPDAGGDVGTADAGTPPPAPPGTTRAGPAGPDANPAGPAGPDPSVVQALLRGSSETTWVLEADARVRWVSPAVTRTLGYDPAWLAGRSIVSLVHPHDAPMIETFVAFGASHRLDGSFEHDNVDLPFDVRLRHRDGHWVTVETLANNFLASPEIAAHLVVTREATGRRALDDALTALAQDSLSDEALRRLLAFVEIRLSGVDAALYWPRGDPAWIPSRVPSNLLVDDGPWDKAVASGEHVLIEDVPAAAADGLLPPALGRAAEAAGYVACWCVPVPAPPHPSAGYSYGIPSEHREPLGTLVLWSRRFRQPDLGHWGLTERAAGLAHFALSHRVAERERQAHLTREQEQVRRLQELDAMKTDLVLSVSHELRTPLTSIISFSELLNEQPWRYGAAEQAEYLAVIRRNADRLLRLVDDLLFLGRLESRTVRVTTGTVDVPRLVAAAVEAIGPAALARKVTIEQAVTDGPPLSGDAERGRQLVDNLLSNAVKYTGPGGWARIEAFPSGGGWQVIVADNGIGVAEAEREQVFDRFFRGSNARTAHIGGSGLGLAIAQAVAELHHGGIELVTTPGPGSTFVTTLRDA